MTPGGIAILSTCGLILVALIGGIVELRKARISQTKVEHEMAPNTGGSLRDAVDRTTTATAAIGSKMDKLTEMLHDVDKRLTRVETRTEMIVPRPRADSRDG